jgi:hypothetical protein
MIITDLVSYFHLACLFVVLYDFNCPLAVDFGT